MNPWTASALNVEVAKIIIEENLGNPVEIVAIDQTTMFTGMADGTLAILAASWLDPRGYDVRAEVIGEKAALTIGMSARTPLEHLDWTDAPAGAPWPGYLERFTDAYRADTRAHDAEEELRKIARHAPGARVIVRMVVEASEADWPLSRKFGCSRREALRLMDLGRYLGLDVAGISFHAGSQMREPAMWAATLDAAAELWAQAAAAGHRLRILNIGGGFPAFYGHPLPETRAYAAEVMRMVRHRFGTDALVMAEPGRGLVAEAGVIVAEVMLVARKDQDDLVRWVYLDIGKFSGLAETIDEAIRYQLETRHGDAATGACILAGPSCDSADVLYEKRPVQLPLALEAGDKVRILCTGAYTTSYASVGFNGFPPLDAVFLA